MKPVKKSKPSCRDRKWRGQLTACPAQYKTWLRDRGSLTARIRNRCSAFRVEVLNQGLASPSLDEIRTIKLRPKELGIAREVYLYCADQPVVFAHTILRTRGLRKSWKLVSGLGNRSLGAALFADPRIKRMPLRYKKLTARDKLFQKACKCLPSIPLQLWARRSIFLLMGEPLLVTEVFLPGIVKLKS